MSGIAKAHTHTEEKKYGACYKNSKQRLITASFWSRQKKNIKLRDDQADGDKKWQNATETERKC